MISSQTGVQQGAPSAQCCLLLVLHKVVTSFEADDDCYHILLDAWYGTVIAGDRSRALHLIEELGPHVGPEEQRSWVHTWGFT